MRGKQDDADDDEVTEAGIESFPASDPPAHNMPGRNRLRGASTSAAEGAGGESGEPPAAESGGSPTRWNRDPAVAPPDEDDTPLGRTEQRAAIEQAMARQNVRMHVHETAGPGAPPGTERRGPIYFVAILVVVAAAAVGLWIAFA